MRTGVRLVPAFGMLLASSGVAALVSAQGPPVRNVPEGVSCASCRIVVTPRRTLQRGGDADVIGIPLAVRRDRAGRYWLMQWMSAPRLFDSTGSFLRTIGRRGAGPGEYSNPIDAVELPGDSMLIVDDHAVRATVLDPKLEPIRQVVLPGSGQLRPGAIPEWPTALIVNVWETDWRRPVGPIRRLTLAGPRAAIAESFGAEGRPLSPDEDPEGYVVARAGPDRLWSTQSALYRLSLWSMRGQKLTTLERRAPWFPPPPTSGMGSPTMPPSPRIRTMYQDADGLLWVFITVASPRWREYWPPAPPRGRGGELGERASSVEATERLYVTRVEVLDPAAGRVVARTDLDFWVIDAAAGQQLAIYRVDANDEPLVTIADFALRR